jgi:hypothetical protein
LDQEKQQARVRCGRCGEWVYFGPGDPLDAIYLGTDPVSGEDDFVLGCDLCAGKEVQAVTTEHFPADPAAGAQHLGKFRSFRARLENMHQPRLEWLFEVTEPSQLDGAVLVLRTGIDPATDEQSRAMFESMLDIPAGTLLADPDKHARALVLLGDPLEATLNRKLGRVATDRELRRMIRKTLGRSIGMLKQK